MREQRDPEVSDPEYEKRARVRMQWGIQIPMRDGVSLNATLYMPRDTHVSLPSIFTLTPYIGQTYHDRGLYFASRGFPFLTIDVRGRGNSEGKFTPYVNEASDGYDVVEWLARQPYCNGKVAMWGGSYGGYNQWVTAGQLPPHLTTIVPVASPCVGVDFPIRNNVPTPYCMQWLTLVSGRASQEKIFLQDISFWSVRFKQWFESGVPFRELDEFLGVPSTVFQEWIAHPHQDSYWDELNPTREQYAELSLPILTITGSYDGDQPGALTHYREHLRSGGAGGDIGHYLVIGPWDHAGTRTPQPGFLGLKVGPASLIDLDNLHLQWYAWTMKAGPKPEFLRKKVAYYVMGADKWRYSDTLESITDHWEEFNLWSAANPADVLHSGSLSTELPAEGGPDFYIYDPSDITHSDMESLIPPESPTDQRMVYARTGGQLVYHSAPFTQDTEVSGFFRFLAWFSIDRPDTDFSVSVYEIGVDGVSVLLTADWMRARYRESLRAEKLIATQEPQCYNFNRFTFVSRKLGRGCRLRLVIGPINSIYSQKNYNSGGVVSEESVNDARPATVKLFHESSLRSVLYVPYAQRES